MAREKRIITLDRPVNVTEELKRLRERAGLSMEEISKALGYKGPSSYQRYESATQFRKPYLPTDLVGKLAQILQGKGQPPIEPLEVLRLAGITKIVNQAAPEGLYITSLQESPGPRLIPIITNQQIDMFITRVHKRDRSYTYVSADGDVSEQAFCLVVTDNSMEPKFSSGDKIICSPQDSYSPGDFVIAKMANEIAAVVRRFRIKKYATNGNQVIELIPLNPDYPTVIMSNDNPGRVYARVVEHRKKI
jgi:SOS-response transcriptional repressor LexA